MVDDDVGEVDISDYFNNDMVHVLRGIGGKKYYKRFGFLSGDQLQFIIASSVTSEVFANPDKYPYAGDVFNLVGKEVSLRSVSVSGKGLGFLKHIVGKQKEVKDKIKVDEDKADLKDL